ncbi:MscL family protein [Mycoplasmopsis gallopavonis]|uniref:Large conductance mechanosensitive channel protein n=1 Tax=Mycoplasmopsis gallopavonis TaxID=76629 RepID=A0A449AZF5_9BACT|nr:MscL family protein [Mycoplasmopsis gallopavonis]RIV16415.1 MscL family protein [Mycoplasmopsis gallopavonis]VEU72867.1 large conductance mechanosensitive channel protein [Mycoplasmopsis gallopavonis]
MSKFSKAVKDSKAILKKGNILLLAVAFILGAVFSALVKSFADDIIMSPISSILGFDELKNMVYGGVRIGNFLAALLTFIIVSLVIFVILVVYFLIMNHIQAIKEAKNPTPAPAAPQPSTDELILAELQKLNDNLAKK